MSTWILIAYLSMYNSGGPVSATFATKTACEAAITTLKKEGYRYVTWAICISSYGER